MKFQEIKNGIYYCGLNDSNREFFDELIPLENGTSYNSYLVKGSEKTVLVDTMYPPKSEEYIKNLEENGVDKVDYIVANHGEQDHTGTIPALLNKYPNAKVVTNMICKNNIKEMLLVDEDKFIVVKHGETLSLGDKTLKFLLAPGVHWPDTMFTYIEEDNVLCTCDFLGAHYTFDDCIAVPSKELENSAKRYYAEIMMPFRMMCKKYIKMIEEIAPEYILPSHGPVYDKPQFILDLYKDWTADLGKNLVAIPFVSMYKSSEEMVDYLVEKLAKADIEAVKFNTVGGDAGDFAMTAVDATTLIFAAPMVLASPHPMIANLAYLVNLLKPKAKFVSFIGSYGWGGDLFGKLSNIVSDLKVENISPVLVKGKPKANDFAALDVLAEEIIKRHKELF